MTTSPTPPTPPTPEQQLERTANQALVKVGALTLANDELRLAFERLVGQYQALTTKLTEAGVEWEAMLAPPEPEPEEDAPKKPAKKKAATKKPAAKKK